MRRLLRVQFGFRVIGFVGVLFMLLGAAPANPSYALRVSSDDAFVAGGGVGS